VRVTVWTCPTPGCGNYYGSSSAGDLFESFNQDAQGRPTFPRSRCPDCRQRGLDVDRQPHTLEARDGP
jgi:hypothetical protein